MGSRRRARELALQMLYQHELTRSSRDVMQGEFEDFNSSPASVQAFASELVEGCLEHLQEIDEELERQTSHWRLERLAAVDRNILRLGLYELLFRPDTPPAVVIDEAIEIAKKFGAEDSARFVNGVLDGFLKRRLRAV